MIHPLVRLLYQIHWLLGRMLSIASAFLFSQVLSSFDSGLWAFLCGLASRSSSSFLPPPPPHLFQVQLSNSNSRTSTMKSGKGKGAVKNSKESLKPVDDRRVGKRKAVAKPDKSNKRKTKDKKDPNKPKRPSSAFFVFLEEFRATFKKENPNVKAVSAVGKAGGEKWKSMSVAEKAPYEAKAAKRKAEYEKLMNAYNKKQASTADDGGDESDRSKSEVNDEDEEEAHQEEEEEEEEEEDEEEDDD